MSRFCSFLVIFLMTFAKITAQTDTTIYQITEKRASFPGCDWSWYSEQQKDSCRQMALSDFLRSTLRYPSEAHDNNISGRIVLQFIVEVDGKLSNIKVVKDIGGGCGAEGTRIVNLMNERNIRWVVGTISGKAVRSLFTLPIVFKLQEDPGYNFVDGNQVYYLQDTPLKYKEGDEALKQFLNKNLAIPKALNDSCKAGVMQVEALVKPNGEVKALQIDDFSNLGLDAQFEAIQLLVKTGSNWEYATFKGKSVPTTYNVRIIFKPNTPRCKATNDKFEAAYAKINDGIANAEKKEWDSSIQKFGEAINLMPYNLEPYYLRGLTYMNLQKNAEACADFTKVKSALNLSWVEGILPLLCK